MLRQRQPIQLFFHDNINRFMYFLQQRHLQCFLFRILAMLYVQNKIIQLCLLDNNITQEEEHNQGFRQLSAEFLIHFVHFIHPYMNPLPCFIQSFILYLKTKFFSYISANQVSFLCHILCRSGLDKLLPALEIHHKTTGSLFSPLNDFDKISIKHLFREAFPSFF